MAVSRIDPMVVDERKQIIDARKDNPNMGAYALAAKLCGGPSGYFGPANRPYYSVLSVIRRYDAEQKGSHVIGQ